MFWVKVLTTNLIMPCLPERFRKSWTWPSVWSHSTSAHVSAYVQGVVSLILYMSLLVPYVHAYGERISAMLNDPNGEGSAAFITWYGMVAFFSFFFTAAGFLATIFLVDSAIRFIHVLSTGEAMGSLFFSAPLLLVGIVIDRVRETRMTARYGPAEKSDSITIDKGRNLSVRSSRPHDEWSSLLTYTLGDELYELVNEGADPIVEENAFLYLMQPWPEGRIIRRLVRLDGVVVERK